MLPDFRNDHPAAFRLLLTTGALAVAIGAAACASEGSCADTATCPPSDAKSEPETSDREDAGFPDVSDGGDARDVSMVDDRVDRADRADAIEVADRFEGGDRSTTGDTASSDRVAIDAADAGPAGPDVSPDSAPDSPPTCDGDAGRSPTDNPCIVSERFGIFVSPGGSDATGAGTRSAPFQTINRGLQAAKRETMRVFVCDTGAGFIEPVAIDATLDGLAVYGGFECAGWTLVAGARTRVHPPVGPALAITGVTIGVTFENFELQAANAAEGASSIAVHVQSSLQVFFRNTRMLAGKGGPGHVGADGIVGQDGEPTGANQRGKPAFCAPPMASQSGGIAVPGACGSKGGNGGACDTVLGSLPGENGIPQDGVDPPNQANGGTNWIHDLFGRNGSDGVAGASGAVNAKGGTFSAAGYTLPAPGSDGTDGHVAQGGGGGSCGEPDSTCVGASGGAGGLGGCGGQRGNGGGAGGASIALFSWMSGITLHQCEIVSADGGSGGNGGNGALGGVGSAGAIGGSGNGDSDAGLTFVRGGSGGAGGHGGPGGGGAGGNGGPTYGIVYAGGRPAQMGGTTVMRGIGGAKGVGGATGISSLPDGGVPDSGTPDSGGAPDAGVARASDGLPGDAAYELAIP
jgi:hypothetical protein